MVSRYGFRAILGDLDIEMTYELLGDSYTPNQSLVCAVTVILKCVQAALARRACAPLGCTRGCALGWRA